MGHLLCSPSSPHATLSFVERSTALRFDIVWQAGLILSVTWNVLGPQFTKDSSVFLSFWVLKTQLSWASPCYRQRKECLESSNKREEELIIHLCFLISTSQLLTFHGICKQSQWLQPSKATGVPRTAGTNMCWNTQSFKNEEGCSSWLPVISEFMVFSWDPHFCQACRVNLLEGIACPHS